MIEWRELFGGRGMRTRRTGYAGGAIALAIALAGGVTRAAAAPEACEDWDCIKRTAGIKERSHLDPSGRKIVTYSGPTTEVEVRMGYAGELDEVRAFRSRPRQILTYDKFGMRERVHERYIRGVLTERSRWWEVPIAGKPIFMEIEQFSKGQLEKVETEWIRSRGQGLATGTHCTDTVTPLVVTSGGIPAIVTGLFNGGTTSASAIRFNTEGCGSGNWVLQQQLMRMSLTEGLQCMLDPARGGGGAPSRGQRDAGIMLAMMANPAQPFTVRCSTRAVIGGDGSGSLCPSFAAQMGDAQAEVPAFPGIAMATDVSFAGEVAQRNFKRTFFHEAMHTVGYPHGHFPEVCYACERCCFPNSGTPVEAACRLCNTPDDPSALTPQYVADYVRVLGDNVNMLPLITFIQRRLDASAPNAAAGFANEVLRQLCPEGNFSNEESCPPKARYAYALFGGIQNRLQAVGSSLATTTVDTNLLNRASANMYDNERVSSNFMIVMTSERARGRTARQALDAALTFFRTYECPRIASGESDPDAVRHGLTEGVSAILDVYRESSSGDPSRVYPNLESRIPRGSDGAPNVTRICSSH